MFSDVKSNMIGTKFFAESHCKVLSSYELPSSATTIGANVCKHMEEVRAFFSSAESASSRCDSLPGVVETVLQLCSSERVHVDIPFRDILACMSGLPVQLYRDVTASERDKDGSVVTRTHGHQENTWANPRRNLRCIKNTKKVTRQSQKNLGWISFNVYE